MSESKSRYYKHVHNKVNELDHKIIKNFYVGKKTEMVCSIENESIYKKIKATEDMDTYDKCSEYERKAHIFTQELLKRCNILNTTNHLKIY